MSILSLKRRPMQTTMNLRFLFICQSVTIGIFIIYWIYSSKLSNKHPVKLNLINEYKATCVLPYMKIPTHKKLIKRYSLNCERNPQNIVSIRNGKFIIEYGDMNDLQCYYRLIIPVNDNKTVLDNSSVIFKHGDPLPSDYFMVYCQSKSGKDIFNMQMQGIKPLQNVAEERLKIIAGPKALNYNVAMLGFDAMSRIAFMEHLPEVYDYFENNMKGVIFKKHGVIGDGSIPNLLAMISGERVETLRETYPTADYFPSVFKDFQRAGYITLFSEDTNAKNAVFQRGLPGFHQKPPIDHFNRPYYLHKVVNIGCLGSLPMYRMYNDLLYQMYDVYDKNVKKFPFIFQVETSHDDNRYIQSAEEDILKTIKEFLPGGKFDNTILFLFSDHGARYSEKRETLQGKYEERMPFLGIYLPKTLQTERPDLLTIVKANSEMLTSPFDIYATLRYILGLPIKETTSSMSLFTPIPSRSCAEADIGAHWCVCNSYRTLKNNDTDGVKAANAVLHKVNEISQKHRNLCAELYLNRLTSVQQLQVNNKMLTFKKTQENDYVLGKIDESDTIPPEEIIYLVTFSASPGDGIFEATVRLNLLTSEFTVLQSEISRINAYAPWIKCIGNRYMSMRKFCICKDALK